MGLWGLWLGSVILGCGKQPVESEDTEIDSSMSDSTPSSCACGDCETDEGPGAETDTETDTEADTDSAMTSAEAAPGGNVLVILIDDVGLDKVAAYGMHPTPALTPTMDALAAQGVRFTEAYATPNCSPTRGSLLTGRHPSRHGVGRWINPSNTSFDLPEAEVSLPEMLSCSELDYSSVAVGKWHLVTWDHPDPGAHPLLHGFERHAGSLGNPQQALQSADDTLGYYNWEKATDGEVAWSDTYMTVDSTDEALDRIADTPEPWFLYLAYNAAHVPLDPPPESLVTTPVSETDSELALFEAMIEGLDTELGRLLDGVPADVLADTTIFLIGDNGSPDHGISPPLDPARSKSTVYEGGVRVPLIVTGPLVGCEGCESDAMVHVVDIFPTIAEIAGVDVAALEGADGAPLVLDGESLLPNLLDPELPTERRYLYSEVYYPQGPPPYDYHNRTLRDDVWKLLWVEEEGVLTEYLYQLTPGDLHEGDDLLAAAAGLDDDAAAAFERLSEEMTATARTLTFDH